MCRNYSPMGRIDFEMERMRQEKQAVAEKTPERSPSPQEVMEMLKKIDVAEKQLRLL